MAKALFTTSEAAKELQVTAGRVRQMIVDGELTAKKLGRDLVIRAVDLVHAKKRKTRPGPAANDVKANKRKVARLPVAKKGTSKK